MWPILRKERKIVHYKYIIFNNLNAPIAPRKGTYSCITRPIAKYVEFQWPSQNYKAFTSNLSSVSLPKLHRKPWVTLNEGQKSWKRWILLRGMVPRKLLNCQEIKGPWVVSRCSWLDTRQMKALIGTRQGL